MNAPPYVRTITSMGITSPDGKAFLPAQEAKSGCPRQTGITVSVGSSPHAWQRCRQRSRFSLALAASCRFRSILIVPLASTANSSRLLSSLICLGLSAPRLSVERSMDNSEPSLPKQVSFRSRPIFRTLRGSSAQVFSVKQRAGNWRVLPCTPHAVLYSQRRRRGHWR